MAKKRASRKKPTKKAASRNRSTTSSTTAKTSRCNSQATTSDDRPTSQLLSEEQKELFLNWLAKGASPAMACQKLFLSMHDVAETLNHDADFRQRWQEIDQSLTQNVVSALYQSAMKGSVTAQTFWLKHNPPPGWGDKTSDKDQEHQRSFEDLTDDELLELTKTLGVDPPPEFEAGADSPGDEEESADVSTTDSD